MYSEQVRNRSEICIIFVKMWKNQYFMQGVIDNFCMQGYNGLNVKEVFQWN